MTGDRLPLAELLQKAGEGDFFLHAVAEVEVEGLIGAGQHERSPERLTWRNGWRGRAFDTRLGTLQLRMPKLRQGNCFPPLLEPGMVSEGAGRGHSRSSRKADRRDWRVSTRRVDELVRAWGRSGSSGRLANRRHQGQCRCPFCMIRSPPD